MMPYLKMTDYNFICLTMLSIICLRFPYCTKLMDNLHINNTAPTRTCLPPPGFSSAPNQVNSYGISIPRNTGNFKFYILHILQIDA